MAKTAPYTLSIRPGELVRRGVPLEVHTRVIVNPDSIHGVTVAGHRVDVSLADDKKTILVSTDGLPTGTYTLHVDELLNRKSERLPSSALTFTVIDTPAPVPVSDVVLVHAVRVQVGELETARLPFDGKADGPYVDVFKVQDRTTGAVSELAFDQNGRRVDYSKQLAALAKRRVETYGRVHPTLHDVLQKAKKSQAIRVAIWLQAPDTQPFDKPIKGFVRRVPDVTLKNRVYWAELARRFIDSVSSLRLEVVRIDTSAPIVYVVVPAGVVQELAAHNDVAALFLHEPEGIVDLGNSMAIANSDDVISAGTTGAGVNVAVYENGPDDVSNLSITAQFLAHPTTELHARHTHGIIKNIEANAPHGHASGCNLHSANSMDLDALNWAAHDHGCTVISQSFHRDSEQTTSTLSFDDIFKDNLVLHWPFPTICQAAGNGPSTEFVNHKGFNSLTVANHNDDATALASDSVFRNPSSAHSDRELPEIAANGTAVTAVGATLSGTSMAAPAVAGGTALIQETSSTLKSWPEGCRAILFASAWRNPSGSTYHADLVSHTDAADGSGALDSQAAVAIAKSRRGRNAAAASRGWDVGTLRTADLDAFGLSTFSHFISVPRLTIHPHVKVAVAWDSEISTTDFLGIQLSMNSNLNIDLDLEVRDSSGSVVASSASWNNSYEIAEFDAQPGATYEIKIRRFSGSKDVWYGVAWTVTGWSFFHQRIDETTVLQSFGDL